MASYCKEQGYRAVALSDHGSIASLPEFFKCCKKHELKPILGIEAYVCEQPATVKSPENRHLSHLVMLSKNLQGWKNLLKFVSATNSPEHYYYKPRACWGMLKEFLGDGNTVAISGHCGSSLGEVLWTSPEAYRCNTIEESRQYLHVDWESRAIDMIEKHIDTFGEKNFFVEIQLIDEVNLPMSRLAAECFREIVRKSNGRYRKVCTADSHYVRRSDAVFQRILLASSLGMTLPKVKSRMKAGEDVPLGTFFISDNYHIPTFEEMEAMHDEEELNNSVLISDMCENYDILSKPKLPKVDCPEGHNQISYLRELCEIGWKKKLVDKWVLNTPEQEKIYSDRLEFELSVMEESGFSGYFLIVWDIINYCHSRGWMTGIGRGSVGGSLVAYLSGITDIDPIPYDLLFERFMNPGRSKRGKLPDIDMDVPSAHRDEIIEYIVNKYGKDKVSQMATFGSLLGRSALKEVLRIEDAASFGEMNEITEWIPDQAQIADELEQTGEDSIIRWTLTNRASKLEKWCTLNPDGTLEGPLAEYFAKAIAIEGTHKSQGKHAAGVIISSEPLAECSPMVRDKEGEPVAGFEMGDLESLGLVKFDVLGLSLLDKLMAIVPHLPEGKNINDLEDLETWKTLASGDVKGVFQLELQKRWTKKLKPENIHHLAALISIIRPGVTESMENGKSMTQHYIDRKNGDVEVPSIHPIVDKCLEKTYNVIVYQENAMLLAKEIAGFNLEQADELRTAIGKKLTDVMAKVKVEFIEGAKRLQTVPEEVSNQIFEWIEKSQRYGFCAAHAFEYAHNSYYTAYCKTHAPLKFYEVCLNLADSKLDKLVEIKELVNDARLHKIEVTAPSLSNFFLDFTMHPEKDEISFGVGHIKDVGTTEKKKLEKLYETINKKDSSAFANLSWIEILLKFRKINSKAMRALISAGVLNGPNNKNPRNLMIYEYDSFKPLTDKELEYIEDHMDKSKNLLWHIENMINNHKIGSVRMKTVLGLKSTLTKQMYGMIDSSGWIAQTEKFYMGTCLTPVQIETGDTALIDCSCREIMMGEARGDVTIGVTVNSVYEHTVKRGKSAGQVMAFITGDDGTSELSNIVAFCDQYRMFGHLLLQGNSVIISGKVQNKDGERSFIIDNVLQV
jgi:DNA polymerase-3 subunit alpha